MYLDKSTFTRYREELQEFSPEDFHIGPIETSRKAYVRICCGGNTDARLSGFAELFETEDVYLVGDGFVASNSLIGYMEAQMIILFFEDAEDYRKWLDDGVELDFLQYNDNSQKIFAVSCPNRLDLDELSELIDAKVTTNSDWRKVKGAKLKPNSYIDSMVMIPSGIAPYQSEPIAIPKDARGEYFSGYIGDTDGCDVEGAVFYGCQKYVDGALNSAVGEGDIALSDIRKPLLVGQSLITQGLYGYVTGENSSSFKGSSDLPVEKVSCFDLLRFCNRLSEMQGFRPCYYDIGSGREGSAEWDRSANGYRLLTEKEWEYIARANRTFEYSGSDDPNEVAWYCENSSDKTHLVGTKKENSFGTYDQSGNLFEWCWDLYHPQDAYRVLRGGSWSSSASDLRAAYRGYNSPSFQFSDVGGRLARSPDPLIP